MLGAWVLPCCQDRILLLEQVVGDDELVLRTELQKQASVVIAVAKFHIYLGLLSTVQSVFLLLR